MSQAEGTAQAKKVYIYIQEHENTLNFQKLLYKSNSYQMKWKEYKLLNQARLITLLAESVPQTEIYLKKHFKSSKYSQIYPLIWSQHGSGGGDAYYTTALKVLHYAPVRSPLHPNQITFIPQQIFFKHLQVLGLFQTLVFSLCAFSSYFLLYNIFLK